MIDKMKYENNALKPRATLVERCGRAMVGSNQTKALPRKLAKGGYQGFNSY
jgi:hypothetical protein